MRIVYQRVSKAMVRVDNEIIGAIGKGVVLLIAISDTDTIKEARFLADKCANLRVFQDEQNKMNLSLLDVDGEALVISQFTLYGDCRKGRRPNFIAAAPPELAEELYLKFVELLKECGVRKVETGKFQAMMEVEIHNSGPVTLILEKNY